MRFLLSFFLLFISITSFAQAGNLKQEATKMGNALLQKKYQEFVLFTYPTLLKQMGGKEKMAQSIAQQMKGMEATNTKIIALNYGEPTKIIREGKELQCTIPQQMIMTSGGNKIAAKTTLIAMSKDNGKAWYFLDAGERDLNAIRKQMPNISKSLIIPKPEQPQLIK